MKAFIKRKAIEFFQFHLLNRMEALNAEAMFQHIFAHQCQNAGIVNDFYPVGAAANHSLMYLLYRILTENNVEMIVEMGSGQSSLLIDRLRSPGMKHVCYEEDDNWFQLMRPRLQHCDYKLSPLVSKVIDGVACETYEDLRPIPFDLLLVDGPRGVYQYSRFGCIELIKHNPKNDFVIIFDDCKRPGERQTIAHAESLLAKRGLDIKSNTLVARNCQYVITAGRYRTVSYYY